MLDYDAYDERRNNNAYATYEEIDERQALALGVLLEQWENRELEPQDVLLQAAFVVGIKPSFLAGYEFGRRWLPGTYNFTSEMDGERRRIAARKHKLGPEIKRIADGLKQKIEHIRQQGSDKDEKAKSDIIKDAKSRQQMFRNMSFLKLPDVSREEGLERISEYTEALAALLTLRGQAASSGEEWIVALADETILHIHKEKLEAEYDADHVDEALERKKAEKLAEHQKKIDGVLAECRPEMLAHAPVVVEHIRLIRQKIADGEFDSWQAARAIAETALKPDKPGPYNYLTGAEYKSAIAEFLEGLEVEEKACKALKKDLQKTIDLFRPETEAEVKRSIMRDFARAAAYEGWAAEREAYSKEHGGIFSLLPIDRGTFDIEGRPGTPPEQEDLEFRLPFELPAEKICNGLYIEPVGTALIAPYERGEYWEAHEADLYGESVARITTYQVSFVPSAPQHLDRLTKAVEDALRAMVDTDYKYSLPVGLWNARATGQAYERPYRYYGDEFRNVGVSTQDGKATPHVRLDLDDLWVLYYLLEPIIEPNAQIAAAMNMARYAEERGAILEPDPVEYMETQEHIIGDTSGVLALAQPEDVLKAAMRDAFVDLALNKIDEVEFMLRMSVLASHTLTGDIRDPERRFAPYALLTAGEGQSEAQALVPADVLHTRMCDLVRSITGPAQHADETLADALTRAVGRVTGPLREHFRAKDREDEVAMRAAIIRKIEGDMERIQGMSIKDMMRAVGLDPDNPADEPEGDQEYEEPPSGPLAPITQLVVTQSAVETQLDGLYAGGRYRTRTRGSLLIRKELPEALKPFIKQGVRVEPLKSLMEPARG